VVGAPSQGRVRLFAVRCGFAVLRFDGVRVCVFVRILNFAVGSALIGGQARLRPVSAGPWSVPSAWELIVAGVPSYVPGARRRQVVSFCSGLCFACGGFGLRWFPFRNGPGTPVGKCPSQASVSKMLEFRGFFGVWKVVQARAVAPCLYETMVKGLAALRNGQATHAKRSGYSPPSRT